MDHHSQHQHHHETWAHGDRPAQPLYNQFWISHVRGSELILSTLNATNSISYQLNRNDELITITRLRSPYLQHQVHYFNLNSTAEKTSIDGHTFHIKSSDNRNLTVSNTRTQCDCMKDSPLLPKSFIGDIPHVIVCDTQNTKDDIIICDAIFTLESIDKSSSITAHLQYEDRCMRLELKPTIINLQNTSSANQASSNACSSIVAPSNQVVQSGSSSLAVPPNSPNQQQLVDSSNMNVNNNQSVASIDSLKLRVRITSFGACLIPIMMSSYTCSYKFYY